jgi:hypothetical protein
MLGAYLHINCKSLSVDTLCGSVIFDFCVLEKYNQNSIKDGNQYEIKIKL